MKLNSALTIATLFVATLSANSAKASSFELSSNFAVESDFQADPGKTKFQTLVDAYESSPEPANLDFFKNRASSTCTLVSQTTPDEFSTTDFVVNCANVLSPEVPAHNVPATPANGPLFPAQPAHRNPGHPRVCAPNSEILTAGSEWVKTLNSAQLAVFGNRLTIKDFIIEVASNHLGIYSDIGSNVQILIRNQANYYPYIVKSSKGVIFAGYCY